MEKTVSMRKVDGLRLSRKTSITVGADPEFELTKDGCVVNVFGIIQGGLSQQIGLDGSGDQVEFRPTYSTDARLLVKNFSKLLRQFKNRYRSYSLTTKGNRYPLGGHIHLGLAGGYQLDGDQIAVLTGVLDDFLGQPTLGLAGSGRYNSSYNHLSEVRRQTWGIEYRSCPANIFGRKELAHLAVKIAKLCFWTCLTKRSFTYQLPLRFEDYKKVCHLSKEQYDLFLSEIAAEWADSQKDLLATWKIKRANAPVPAQNNSRVTDLEFLDEWGDMQQTAFRNTVAAVHNLPSSLRVRLIGLSETRGFVTTVPNSEGVGVVNIPGCSLFSGILTIGIPRAARVGTNDAQISQMCLIVVAAIRVAASRMTEESL